MSSAWIDVLALVAAGSAAVSVYFLESPLPGRTAPAIAMLPEGWSAPRPTRDEPQRYRAHYGHPGWRLPMQNRDERDLRWEPPLDLPLRESSCPAGESWPPCDQVEDGHLYVLDAFVNDPGVIRSLGGDPAKDALFQDANRVRTCYSQYRWLAGGWREVFGHGVCVTVDWRTKRRVEVVRGRFATHFEPEPPRLSAHDAVDKALAFLARTGRDGAALDIRRVEIVLMRDDADFATYRVSTAEVELVIDGRTGNMMRHSCTEKCQAQCKACPEYDAWSR